MVAHFDILTDDQIVSDGTKLIESEADGLWRVNCKYVLVKYPERRVLEDTPSYEGVDPDEDEVDKPARVLDLVYNSRLQMAARPTKAYFVNSVKQYLRAVQAKLAEQDKTEQRTKFMQTAQAALKTIVAVYDDLEMYSGESMGDPAMWVMVIVPEDDTAPYALIWKYGLYTKE